MDDKDVFVELAKVKGVGTALKVETDAEPPALDEESEGQLTVDVYRDGDTIVVQSTVAGVSPEDLEINITGESVTIRGRREKTEKVEDKDYFYQECFWGQFSRSIILPYEIDPERSTAAVKSGVLTVRLPKLNRQKMKKLKIKTD